MAELHEEDLTFIAYSLYFFSALMAMVAFVTTVKGCSRLSESRAQRSSGFPKLYRAPHYHHGKAAFDPATAPADEKRAMKAIDEIISGSVSGSSSSSSRSSNNNNSSSKGPPAAVGPWAVLPGLVFFGPRQTALDVDKLSQLGITTVINLAPTELRAEEKRPDGPRAGLRQKYAARGIAYHQFDVADHRGFPLLVGPEACGDDVCRIIAETVGRAGGRPQQQQQEQQQQGGGGGSGGGGVLVHCFSGINRSAAMVAAFLIVHRSFHVLDAVRSVVRCYPKALTNESFRHQLVLLAKGQSMRRR